MFKDEKKSDLGSVYKFPVLKMGGGGAKIEQNAPIFKKNICFEEKHL
jgi:hypothetical protein